MARGRALSRTTRSQMPGEVISQKPQEMREENKRGDSNLREVQGMEEERHQERSRGTFSTSKIGSSRTFKTSTSSFDSTSAAKETLKKPLKGKTAPRKKAQGKTQRNCKLRFVPGPKELREEHSEPQSEERKK
ncbi:Hypothetical predicted protein [Marmota monax]|uniref:Uncharacterized protein n=1 Tax=Marmota monax TaxID=9995 RepID=A0A5E4B963_MARMO|nr:hypothetical protein GHT09_004244 [Marmota monax]VTJ65411.1 Hypothetical predicted protein [Marmota monax]